MRIQIPELIVAVSCPAQVSEDDFPGGDPSDRFDTGTQGEHENFQVRASSIEQLTARSFRVHNVEIETNRDDREEESMLTEAGEMLVKDYIEGTQCDEYGDEVSLLTAFK